MFPAHAGVILLRTILAGNIEGVPRTRGGDPISSVKFFGITGCSPHTRG